MTLLSRLSLQVCSNPPCETHETGTTNTATTATGNLPTHLQPEDLGGGTWGRRMGKRSHFLFLLYSSAAGWRQPAGRLDGAVLLPLLFSRARLLLHHGHSEQSCYDSDTGHTHPWTSHTCELAVATHTSPDN